MPDTPDDDPILPEPDPAARRQDDLQKPTEESRASGPPKEVPALRPPKGPNWRLRDEFPPEPPETDVPLRDDPK